MMRDRVIERARCAMGEKRTTNDDVQTDKQKVQNAGTQIHYYRSILSAQVNNNEIIGEQGKKRIE